MAKAASKKTVDSTTTLITDVKHYARQIWLAGLGAYARAGQESSGYFKQLVKTGEGLETKGRKKLEARVDAANDSVKDGVSSVKLQVEGRLDRIEKAFDDRVAATLNRLGIPSRQDVEALSAKLDQLSEVLERVARTH